MDRKDSVYVDAHCHLLDSSFDPDLSDVIENARQAEVAAALVVTENNSELESVLALADKYPDFVLPCCGIHPVQEVENNGEFEQRCVLEEDMIGVEEFIVENHDKLAAIGEIGLDFMPRVCKTDENREIQRKVFSHQVKLAMQYDLPVNVHSRSAGRPTINLLKELGAKNVLLHAFDGKPGVALQAVELGYFFSIPPSIVRSPQKSKLVHALPLTHILLETDSPALSPDKEVRNEPKNVQISCQYIANVKGLSLEEVRFITTQNAIKLFPKLKTLLKL